MLKARSSLITPGIYRRLPRTIITSGLASEPNVPSNAFQFASGANWEYLPAKMGQPLSVTYFCWFKVPPYNLQAALTGFSFLDHFGTVVNDDVEEFPGIGIRLNASGTGVNDPFTVIFEAYGFDGSNQVRKTSFACRNTANTANTFPLQRNVYYSFYISINFDDGNATEVFLGPNTATGCTTTWYGDTDPIFPVVPFNPLTTVGDTTYFVGEIYSLGGGEAICDTGFDGMAALVTQSGSGSTAFNRANLVSFYQPWADVVAQDQSGVGHLRFVTVGNHWKDLGASGELPFGSGPPVYFSTAISPPNNVGFNSAYTIQGTNPSLVVGPV